jgi:hypothetical protein
MHNEYFIEKRRLPVEVELVSGEHVGGDLFIQASWRGPSLLEDAPEFMNASEAFFPIQLADGSTRLLAKEHVSVLKAPPTDLPEGAELYGIPESVLIALRNGSSVAGTLIIEVLAPNMRLLDYLNRVTDPFITLREPEATLLVNRHHVVSVTSLSNGAD